MVELKKAGSILEVNVAQIPLINDRQFMGWAIEVLNQKRYYIKINHVLKSLNSDISLNYSVLNKVTDCVIEQKPLEKKSLVEFFDLKKKAWHLFDTFLPLARINQSFTDEIDFLVLGQGFDLDHEEVPNRLRMDYELLLADFYEDRRNFSTFKTTAIELIKKHRQAYLNGFEPV